MTEPCTYSDDHEVPPRYQTCSFENLKASTNNTRHALETCRKWANDPKDFLFLTGPCGTGKTHLAVATLKSCPAPRKLFSTAAGMLLSIRTCIPKEGGEKAGLQKYLWPNVLLLDDLGSEKQTEWVIQAMYLIINYRYDVLRPTIITSNYSADQRAEIFGDRLISRVATGTVITLTGEDFRVSAARKLASAHRILEGKYEKQSTGGQKSNASV